MKYEIKELDLVKNKNLFVAINKKYICDVYENDDLKYQKNRTMYYSGNQIIFIKEKKVLSLEKRISSEILKNMRQISLEQFISFLNKYDFDYKDENKEFIANCIVKPKFYFIYENMFEEKLYTLDFITYETKKAEIEDLYNFSKYYQCNFFADEQFIIKLLNRKKSFYNIIKIEDDYYFRINNNKYYSSNNNVEDINIFNEKEILDYTKCGIREIISENITRNKEEKNYCLNLINFKDDLYIPETYIELIFQSDKSRFDCLTKKPFKDLTFDSNGLIDFIKDGENTILFFTNYFDDNYIIEINKDNKIVKKIELKDNFLFFNKESYLENSFNKISDYSEVRFVENLKRYKNFKIYGTLDKFVKCYWYKSYKEFVFVDFKEKIYCIKCNSKFSPLYCQENLYETIENNFSEFLLEHQSTVMISTLGD